VRRIVLMALLCIPLPAVDAATSPGPASAAADSSSLDEVLAGIETPRDRPVQFVEVRMNPLLKEPLQLHGVVIFASDGSLAKVVSEPFDERVRISADFIEMQRGGRLRRLPLKRGHELGELYAGLRALLEGDAVTVNEIFVAGVVSGGVKEHWRFELEPRSSRFGEYAQRLVISGEAGQVRVIRVELTGGEWQEMTLETSSRIEEAPDTDHD